MKKHWILIAATLLLLIGVFICKIYGNDFQIGSLPFKYFSSGDYAIGIFAAGKFSMGVFSVGIFSIGIFSIGIFNIGLYAVGLFVVALRKRLPNLFLQQFNSLNMELKKPLLILVLIGISGTLSAQDSTKIAITGGFGGPILNYSQMASEQTVAIGGGGAVVFNKGLFLGGYGIATSDLVTVNSIYNNYKLQVEYGGIWLGYIKKLKHNYRLTPSFKTGFGKAVLNNDEQDQSYSDNLVVFTPEIAFSKRINSFSSLELGLFYNLFTGINFQDYHNNDFSNFGISLMLKFGGGNF